MTDRPPAAAGRPTPNARVVMALLVAGIFALVGGSLDAAQSWAHGDEPERMAPAAGNVPAVCGDLVIESLLISPERPVPGTSVAVRVRFKNQGDAEIAGFRVALYVDPDQAPPTDTTTPSAQVFYGVSLKPGDVQELTGGSLVYPAAGDHVVFAWVDPGNVASECDKSNNLAGPVTLRVSEAPDAYEPDDACEQATPIETGGAAQERNLSPETDEDWVTFQTTAGSTYRVEASPADGDADPALDLFSACDRLTFSSGPAFTFVAWASGPMHLRVRQEGAQGGPRTAYRLRITGDDACNGRYEPNNACSLAGDIGVDAPQTHTFCRENDLDWARLEVEAGASYLISARHTGAEANTLLSLYRTCGQQGNFGSDQEIEFTAPASGVVYVLGEQIHPEVFGATTEYVLEVKRTASGCEPDALEPDGGPDQAAAVQVDGAMQRHDFCPERDVDWATFPAEIGRQYTIETSNLGTAADTTLCLYDTGGRTLLRCDDDSGEGLGSRIIWQAERGGDYHLRIANRNGDAAGEATLYDLRVATSLCQADGYEPNDDRTTATLITPGVPSARQNVCPEADEDWATFDVEPGSYVIETSQLGAEANTVLELYDAAGILLARNDDFGPGGASRIVQTFAAAGAYTTRVRHLSETSFGTGTEYVLQVRPGAPTPLPATPSPAPTPTATPAPQFSPVRTIVLVNPAQVALIHGSDKAASLMAKLDELAAHELVKGEVLQLDGNEAIREAYAAWNLQPTSVDSANQVASAIRGMVMTYLGQHQGIEHLVLVGDDRLLPFRRMRDPSATRPSEREYGVKVDPTHPTGAALKDDYFLSDDYYADRRPASILGRELYVPEVAVGRLVESPDDIIPFIDNFLAHPVTQADKVLVTGYDFVMDVADKNCEAWLLDEADRQADCTLIGDEWTSGSLAARQLHADPPFKVQSINGHANHYAEGAPAVAGSVSVIEIAGATSDLSGGLIYTPGCQSGLNVPPENTRSSALDLPEAFSQQLANYIGNTGFGWGSRETITLSERLMLLYTEELTRDKETSIGKALMAAKQRYVREQSGLGSLDEKVLQELTLYGLPMYRLHSGGDPSLEGDPFPSVDADLDLPLAQEAGESEVAAGILTVRVAGALSEAYEEKETGAGGYLALDSHTTGIIDQAIQPLYFADVDAPAWPARSVLFLEGAYATQSSFDPVVPSLANEYTTGSSEGVLDDTLGWQPPLPVTLQDLDTQAHVVAQMGQYLPAAGELRVYEDLKTAVLYSTASDRLPPSIHLIEGAYDSGSGMAAFKVGAGDASGISRVLVTYTGSKGGEGGAWQSIDLAYSPHTDVWTGSLTTGPDMRFVVQVADGAGNVTVESNKGHYLAPEETSGAILAQTLYLPAIIRRP